MQLSADEISSIIKKQIQNFDRAAMVSETGTVLATGDGIARVYGLEGVMAGELVEFPGNLFGLTLNLEQDNVGVAVLGDASGVKEGDVVSIDTGNKLNGWCGDSAITHAVGKIDAESQKLLDVTKLTSLGWRPKIALEDGIRETYRWFLDRQ